MVHYKLTAMVILLSTYQFICEDLILKNVPNFGCDICLFMFKVHCFGAKSVAKLYCMQWTMSVLFKSTHVAWIFMSDFGCHNNFHIPQLRRHINCFSFSLELADAHLY